MVDTTGCCNGMGTKISVRIERCKSNLETELHVMVENRINYHINNPVIFLKN